MKNDLIERYIYAVTRYLPLKLRGDVEKELDSLISDMLEERCRDITPSEKDIRGVLMELGMPEELALKYSGDENRAFISGVYLLIYKRILKIVLPVVALGITFANIIIFFKTQIMFSNLIISIYWVWHTITRAILGTGFAFFVITFVIIFFQWKKAGVKNGDFFSILPPVPPKKAQIKPYQAIGGMIGAVFVTVLFLFFPQFIGAWFTDSGWVPVFSETALQNLWFPIVLAAILCIAKETVKLIEGGYTKRLATVTLAFNILMMVCPLVVFLNSDIMNPDFVSGISHLLAVKSSNVALDLLTNLNLLLLGVIVFALILEPIIVLVTARRYNKIR